MGMDDALLGWSLTESQILRRLPVMQKRPAWIGLVDWTIEEDMFGWSWIVGAWIDRWTMHGLNGVSFECSSAAELIEQRCALSRRCH